jgi:hypothetical protein
MKTAISVLWGTLVLVSAGCASNISSKPVKEADAVEGVRWIETRQYDVYVYVGGAPTKEIVGPDGKKIVLGKPNQLYFGTHDLLDRVNGIVLDSNRPIWEVNYKADTFSDGTLNLEFHDNGSLKKAKLLGKGGTADAARAATSAVKAQEDVAADKISDIERETKRLKAEKELRDARKALEGK